MLQVNSERCTGCGACLNICKAGAIHLVNGIAHIDTDKCQECRGCLYTCPQGAIELIHNQPPVFKAQAVILPESHSMPPKPPDSTAHSVSKPLVSNLGAALALLSQKIVPAAATSLLELWKHSQALWAARRQKFIGR